MDWIATKLMQSHPMFERIRIIQLPGQFLPSDAAWVLDMHCNIYGWKTQNC
jgi:hypothetical protein